MAVHVDEIHTQVTSATPHRDTGAQPGQPADGIAPQAMSQLAAGEDSWRRASARVVQLRCRVAAEGFDD